MMDVSTKEHIRVLQAFEQKIRLKKQMKVKLLSRGEGKTTIAIRKSNREQVPIVCFDSNAIYAVQRLAETLKVTIPQPIRFDDFLENCQKYPRVIIDNLDICFARLMPDSEIIMITLNDD